MSKLKNASKAVVDYLDKLTKPDSLQSISNNLVDFGKSDVTKALNSLVENETVKEKTYGKSKIYYINQKNLNKGKQLDVAELDRLIMDKREILRTIENNIKEKETELKEFDGKLSKKQLDEEIGTYRTKIEEVEVKLKEITNAKKKNQVKADKYKNINYETVSKECRKRKRIAKDIVDSLLEFQPKNKKRLLEDIGIENFN